MVVPWTQDLKIFLVIRLTIKTRIFLFWTYYVHTKSAGSSDLHPQEFMSIGSALSAARLSDMHNVDLDHFYACVEQEMHLFCCGLSMLEGTTIAANNSQQYNMGLKLTDDNVAYLQCSDNTFQS